MRCPRKFSIFVLGMRAVYSFDSPIRKKNARTATDNREFEDKTKIRDDCTTAPACRDCRALSTLSALSAVALSSQYGARLLTTHSLAGHRSPTSYVATRCARDITRSSVVPAYDTVPRSHPSADQAGRDLPSCLRDCVSKLTLQIILQAAKSKISLHETLFNGGALGGDLHG